MKLHSTGQKVAICVATRERPMGLERLLRSFASLDFKKIDATQLEVNVADNDSACSARAVCERVRGEVPFEIRYCHEPQKGISFARNASLSLISPDIDFIAFIDDDEVPSSSWLDELLAAQHDLAADVVCGPCLPIFPEEGAPKWVMRGGFFDAWRHETGDELPWAATHNTLVTRRVIDHFSPPFDPKFALTGGSDHHLFMRARKAGFKIVWCDTAIVREWIPISRMTLKWILMRAFRTSSHHVLCERELYPWQLVFFRRLATGTGRISIGLASLPFTLVMPTQMRVRALAQMSRGAGLLSGLLGYRRYLEYATVHKA